MKTNMEEKLHRCAGPPPVDRSFSIIYSTAHRSLALSARYILLIPQDDSVVDIVFAGVITVGDGDGGIS